MERKARGDIKEVEKEINKFEDLLARYNNEEDVKVQFDAVAVVSKAVPKFVRKYDALLKNRAFRLGKWLCAQHKSKGASSMEFESKAAIVYATRWLDQNQSTLEEEDNTGEDDEAFDEADPMMKQLFSEDQRFDATEISHSFRSKK